MFVIESKALHSGCPSAQGARVFASMRMLELSKLLLSGERVDGLEFLLVDAYSAYIAAIMGAPPRVLS